MLNWIETKKFVVTEEHIKLLKRMIVSWDDRATGAPAIDCLQPYGTMCPQCDLAKLLGVKAPLDEEKIDYMEQMHKETQIALSIFLKTGIMEPGTYEHDGFYNWRKNDERNEQF